MRRQNQDFKHGIIFQALRKIRVFVIIVVNKNTKKGLQDYPVTIKGKTFVEAFALYVFMIE